RAVVIDPNGERGSRMAGLLQGLGFRVDLLATARDGFEKAASAGGADLVAVHANVQDLPVSQFIANLRADTRTRTVPAVLYGQERLAGPLSRIATRAGGATAVSFPIAAETLERELAPLRQAAPPLPDDLTSEQKRVAAAELAGLAEADERTFPLIGALPELATAIADPVVSADVATALATIPRPNAQETLAESLTIIRPGAEAELAAADALTRSVRRFGSLLEPSFVSAVRERADAEQEPALRDALLTLSAALPDPREPLPVEVALPPQ
ncbi:MAG: hypothetical protein AAF907_04345, partial [Planctomycetota bacterium]